MGGSQPEVRAEGRTPHITTSDFSSEKGRSLSLPGELGQQLGERGTRLERRASLHGGELVGERRRRETERTESRPRRRSLQSCLFFSNLDPVPERPGGRTPEPSPMSTAITHLWIIQHLLQYWVCLLCMAGLTDLVIGRWIKRLIVESINRWIDKKMCRLVGWFVSDALTNQLIVLLICWTINWLIEWDLVGWMDEWRDGQMDGQTDGRMNG